MRVAFQDDEEKLVELLCSKLEIASTNKGWHKNNFLIKFFFFVLLYHLGIKSK